MAEYVLLMLLSFHPYRLDMNETLEQRRALLMPVAQAIANVARTKEQIAFLASDGFHESGYARAVLEGRCQDMPAGERCDNGRARGPWQVWSPCKATSLEGQARCVLSQAGLGKARCSSWEGAFSALKGTEGRCHWVRAAKRVQSMRWLLEKFP